MDCVPDHEFAMREVAQAYELIKSQQPLLQFCNEQPSSGTTTVVQNLLNKALQALRLALSAMDPQLPGAVAGHSSSATANRPHLLRQKSSAGAGDSKGVMSKRRSTSCTRVELVYHLVVIPSVLKNNVVVLDKV
jgi:hypothetical protein